MTKAMGWLAAAALFLVAELSVPDGTHPYAFKVALTVALAACAVTCYVKAVNITARILAARSGDRDDHD